MKKNKMMRIASILMVATLITTCAISGTFAKYVTKAEGFDQARVAKWGILVSVSGGELFDEKYPAKDEAYLAAEGKYSVESSVEGEKVVAPGTSSDEIKSTLTATVTGTPEVATRYTLEGKGIKDVVLKKGTYTDYTHLVYTEGTPATEEAAATEGSYGYTDTFELKADYAPVKWNLVIEGKGQTINVADALYANIPAENIAQAEALGLTKEGCSFFDAIAILKKVAGNDDYVNIVEAALGQIVSGGRNFTLEADKDAGTFKLGYDFDANKEMDFKFTLSWEWAFENGKLNEETGLYEFDAADTYLGNVAAGVVTDQNANTTISATLVATATQID